MPTAVPGVNLGGLAILLLDAVVLTVIVLQPMSRHYDDSDKGSGNVVLMTPPLRPSYKRCSVFLLASLVVSCLLVGLRSPSPTDLYHRLVEQLINSVIHDPAAVSGYAKALPPVFQVSFAAFGVAFAVTFRASLGRRVMILLHVALGLLVSAVVDAWIGVVVLETHIPLGPTPLVNILMQFLVAGIIVLRLSFTSFQLPKLTPIPLSRGNDWINDAVLVACFGLALFVTAALATWLVTRFGDDPFVTAIIVFCCPPYLFLLTTLSLGFVRLFSRRRVNPTPERPPIEVIIPAYNEEIVIEDLLRSLDVAAGRYGGPVRVLLCDDGSTDSTIEVAEAVMQAYEYADGEIIMGRHGGKSAALNQALAQCRADLVFRLDADCIAHPDCFVYAVPYFLTDPEVGLVSAFTVPKEPYTTWIDRMRLFEVIVLFGLVRPASDVVDGIYCVPGYFTGFRREAALEVGGFIEGMYGEDVEFTYSVTRLGYKVATDSRIRSYEDVPNTLRQLRIQRTRWNRGGTMSFSRNVPIVTGLAGPRVWFFASRQAVRRALMPLRLSLFTYLLAEATFNPNSHVNLVRVALIILIRAVPSFVQTVTLVTYYGKAKELIYLPLQYVFVNLKHYYSLEAFLSFNSRPLITGRIVDALRPAQEEAPELESAEALA